MPEPSQHTRTKAVASAIMTETLLTPDMTFSRYVSIAWLSLATVCPSAPSAAVWNVWATEVDDFDVGVTASGRQVQNAVWRDHRIQLTVSSDGAASCQIVLEGDEAGARQVVARGPELWQDHGPAVIRPAGAGSQFHAGGFGTRISLLAGPVRSGRSGAPTTDDIVTALPRRGRLRLRLDIRVPTDQAPGLYKGGIIVDADRQRVLVPIEVRVGPGSGP